MKTLLSLLVPFAFVLAPVAHSATPTEITVYKSPTCRCCGKWEDHLRANGFKVVSKPSDDYAKIKDDKKIPQQARSCHTGVIGDYYIEGHVPASVIKKFLKSPPKDSAGLAVADMPVGSPGMENGDQKQEYDVLRVDRSGAISTYETIPGNIPKHVN